MILFTLFTVVEIFLYFLAPVIVYPALTAHCGERSGNCVIDHLCTFLICVIIYGS